MSPKVNEDIFSNVTETLNLYNGSTSTLQLSFTTTSTTVKPILKPSVVETDILKQSLVAKPTVDTEKINPKPICVNLFCCYHYNDTKQNETIINNPFQCQEKTDDQSSDCKNVLSFCSSLTSQICIIDKTDIRCRIDKICGNDKKLNCSIQSVDAAIYSSSTTTATTTLSSTIVPTTSTTTTLSTTTTTLPSTSTATTTISKLHRSFLCRF
jgi:hypothetical protein